MVSMPKEKIQSLLEDIRKIQQKKKQKKQKNNNKKPVAKKITYVACTIFLLDSTALGWSGIEDREW